MEATRAKPKAKKKAVKQRDNKVHQQEVKKHGKEAVNVKGEGVSSTPQTTHDEGQALLLGNNNTGRKSDLKSLDPEYENNSASSSTIGVASVEGVVKRVEGSGTGDVNEMVEGSKKADKVSAGGDKKSSLKLSDVKKLEMNKEDSIGSKLISLPNPQNIGTEGRAITTTSTSNAGPAHQASGAPGNAVLEEDRGTQIASEAASRQEQQLQPSGTNNLAGASAPPELSSPLTQNVVSSAPSLTQNSVSSAPPLTQNPVSSAPPLTQNSVSSAPPLSQNLVSSAPPLTQNLVSSAPPFSQKLVSSAPPLSQKASAVLLSQKASAPPLTQIEESSAPSLIDLGAAVSSSPSVETATSRTVPQETEVVYPKLDIPSEGEVNMEDLCPFTEEDLTMFCPNPQLDSNQAFVDNFLVSISNINGETHALYDLLMTYLKTKRSLTHSLNHLEDLQKNYKTNNNLVWQFENKEASATGRCGDGSKVADNYPYRVAVFYTDHLLPVTATLKDIRKLLDEELCMKWYNSQLARVHVEEHLFLLMSSVPELADLTSSSPVTGWVPNCPPGSLDGYCSHLRDSISVLFHFERQPLVDQDFSQDCRNWLRQLISVLLRVSSLVDHQFLLNHLLRCPAGVGTWGAELLHVTHPSVTKSLLNCQLQTRGNSHYSQDWGVGLGLHGDWGGPVLDHFVMMLSTLMLPIKEREKFMSSVRSEDGSPAALSRNVSVPWAFIDETDEGSETSRSNEAVLSESDYILFFQQFPFSDMFAYILQYSSEEGYSTSGVTSHQMMRLISFCTCLVRLLGTSFSTLRLARYREFSKQVGQTIRNAVAFVSDHWSAYRSQRLLHGDDPSSLPPEPQGLEYRHSLNRLQLELDQFVLRSIKWILTAQKLGAWQFLADMPYGSISLNTVWSIFWNIYCKDSLTSPGDRGGDQSGGVAEARISRAFSPCSVDDIQEALKVGSHKDQFVDRLMKTYTSEAVFLLTTLVNMVRARSCDSHTGSCDSEAERAFINTVSLEIFECTHVVEYARETYFKTGRDLLDSIAVVHPFIISTLLSRVETAIGAVGENCIILFNTLSLHLWVPLPRDIELVQSWLLQYPLNSSENRLARNILSSLHWGTKAKEGSFDLVLPWSVHCFTALCLVQALARHLPYHPGGQNYMQGSVSKITTRFTTSQAQLEFEQWAWEVALMLKLHPYQVSSHIKDTLCPSSANRATVGKASGPAKPISGWARNRSGTLAQGSTLQLPAWVHLDPGSGELLLPNCELAATVVATPELMELREATRSEGLLAYYVTLSITDAGTDTDRFISVGLTKLQHLVDQGYYKASLKLLANILPRFFVHAKILLQDTTFLSVLLALANADSDGASMKEKWITGSVSKVTKMLSALIQTQLQEASNPLLVGEMGGAVGSGAGGGEAVLKFWLEVLLSCPTWLKEGNLLYILNNLCMATFFNHKWTLIVTDKLLEAYQALSPLQPKKGLVSSVYASVASMVWQDGGTPSLFNSISHQDLPWLSYAALCAEQEFEESHKIWSQLLLQLKSDQKILLDSALKRTFLVLKSGGSFPFTHLCLYRWAEFGNILDCTHPVTPLVWQRFFTLYLSRTPGNTDEVGKEGYGHRFYSASRNHAQYRELRSTLLEHCRKLQTYITALESQDWAEKVGVNDPSDAKRDTLRSYYPRCLKLYQTLRLWLQEPRLHTAKLHLPGLPPSYDSARLASIFKGNKAPWVEFIPEWDLKAELNSSVMEWVQLAAYQKSLPFRPQPSQLKQSTVASRIGSRLQAQAVPQARMSPEFQFCRPPFSPLPHNVLLSRELFLAEVNQDMELLVNQAKQYNSATLVLSVFDDEYVSALPDLFSNNPRQFHMDIPCRKMFNRNFQCSSPATLVFRFNEATLRTHLDGQLKDNRKEWGESVEVLSSSLSLDLVQRLVRLEHSVAELARLNQHNKEFGKVAFENGVQLFFRVLGYYQSETRKYPPSKQFLSSCISILGQTFVQQDPQQATNLLNLLLVDSDNADILGPLFQPNVCPQHFVRMYESTLELAEKHGPNVTFSVLTKFNVVQWLDTYNKAFLEQEELMKYVGKGLNLFGPKPDGSAEALVEVYRQHFVLVLNYKFPKSFQSALHIVLTGTEASSVVVGVWEDFRRCLSGPGGGADSCGVGMQQLELSLHALTTAYCNLRARHQSSAYSLVAHSYIASIGLFLRQLCFCLVCKVCEDISMDVTKLSSGVDMCWHSILGVFEAWLFIMPGDQSSNSRILEAISAHHSCGQLQRISLTAHTLLLREVLPCTERECKEMMVMMEMFVEVLVYSHNNFQVHDPSAPILSRVWSLYFSHMTRPQLTHYILDIYHTSLVALPWKHFYPDLGVLDSMMKLKLDSSISNQCFVFLGIIFPMMDWPSIMREGECVNGEDGAVQFHIMVLQLLMMLISDKTVMQRDDTNMHELILKSQDFSWRLIDAKMFQDVVSWQAKNCTSSSILHKGSSLSLSLRLLKSAAGFPSGSGPCPSHQMNEETWEKRFVLLRAMVELIAQASHRQDSQHNDYTDCVSDLFQIAVDISIHEPEERFSPRLISLLQEVLNLLNVCSMEKSQEDILKVIMYLFKELPNSNILAIPTITAACQSVASLPILVRLAEQVIFTHFHSLQAPPIEPLQLQRDSGMYGWKSVVDFLLVCEEVRAGLVEAAISQCCTLFLHAMVLKDLLQCSSMTEEMQLLPSLVHMCSSLKPKPSDEVKLLVLWMKVLDLLLRQLQFVPNSIPLVMPHFVSLVSIFTRFGEDRCREGLLSRLGFGKKSEYVPKFRLIARSMGVFLQCQMPVDLSGAVQLRLVPNAPGHVKEGSMRSTSSASVPVYSILPTKQNEQALQTLDAMLTNKEYSSLTKSTTTSINFVCNPANSLPGCVQLLTLLAASLYPEYRFLDLLRT